MNRPRWEIEGVDWPHRDHSRFVDAGGLRWHVQQMGEGPALLLLHGTGAATHSWRGLAPLLARQFTVVIPDLPGHGFTAPPPGYRYAMPGIARALAALCEAIGVTPVYLVGHSSGAAIAVRMTLDGLADPAALVAINGALLPFPGPVAQLLPAMARAIFANPFAPRLFAMRAALEGETRRFLTLSSGSTIDAEGVELYERLFRTAGHCAGALGLMAAWDLDTLKRDLPDLDRPLLLLAGTADRMVRPTVATEIGALVRDARVVTLPQLGHLAHEEEPELVASAILPFLADASARNSKPRSGQSS